HFGILRRPDFHRSAAFEANAEQPLSSPVYGGGAELERSESESEGGDRADPPPGATRHLPRKRGRKDIFQLRRKSEGFARSSTGPRVSRLDSAVRKPCGETIGRIGGACTADA